MEARQLGLGSIVSKLNGLGFYHPILLGGEKLGPSPCGLFPNGLRIVQWLLKFGQ
jgi:hypothetical protein